jgi:hypothetical protein
MMDPDLRYVLNSIVASVAVTLFSTAMAFVGTTFRALKRSIAENKAYNYNSMRIMFSMLAKLHPDQLDVINLGLQEFMTLNKPPKQNGAAGEPKFFG